MTEAKKGKTQQGSNQNSVRKKKHLHGNGGSCRLECCLSGMPRALALPSSGYWGALSPPQLFALHLCDSMELLPLSLSSNVKLFFLLLLQYLPKVPFGRWKSWYTSLYVAKAKRFVLRYIPDSSLQKFLPVHHIALLIIYFSCVVLSHRQNSTWSLIVNWVTLLK